MTITESEIRKAVLVAHSYALKGGNPELVSQLLAKRSFEGSTRLGAVTAMLALALVEVDERRRLAEYECQQLRDTNMSLRRNCAEAVAAGGGR